MIIGVISSILAAMIIYLARTQLRILVNFILSGVYPRIEGRYKLEFDETLMAEPTEETFFELQQLGPIIRGIGKTYKDNKITSEDIVRGKITATRVLIFNFETITEAHHNIGAGLFRLSATGSEMSGYLSYICVQCQGAGAMEAKLIKT